jgi:hypothetical protein
MDDLEGKIWFKEAEIGVRDLLHESLVMVKEVPTWTQKFSDYSFVVFPAAKAYEGYLKKIFLDRNFITPNDYYGKHFRIGKALNPSLEERYRDESVYDKVIRFCDGERLLADMMWETWKNCRNMIFHFFPNEKNAITFEEAEARVKDILSTMEEVYQGCKIK